MGHVTTDSLSEMSHAVTPSGGRGICVSHLWAARTIPARRKLAGADSTSPDGVRSKSRSERHALAHPSHEPTVSNSRGD